MGLYTKKTQNNHKNTKNEDLFFEEYEERACCVEPEIGEEDGYYVCMNCGFIHSKIFESSPRRAYTPQDKRNRQIHEVVRTNIGPRTVIRGRRDASGGLLTSDVASKFARLSKIQNSIFDSFERNLKIAVPLLENVRERLHIPKVVARNALNIYQCVVKQKLTIGRSIESLLSASMFAAMRINSIPLTMDEILEITKIPKKQCVKNFKLIQLKVLPNLNFKVKTLDPDMYIDRFVNDLKLPMECRNYAVKLLNEAKDRGYNISGKDPKGLAAALIYTASKVCGEKRTQREICDISQITQLTLRKRRTELSKYIVV
ncbi:MAG: transcription initiation factor IIB family protein [Promethearchaeota archaeon]